MTNLVPIPIPLDWTCLMPETSGFSIRIGNEHDGGYVVNSNDLKNAEVLLSFGLGNDFSFEKQFKKLNPKCRVLVFDHTITYPDFIQFSYKCFKLFVQFKIKNCLDYIRTYLDYQNFFNSKDVSHLQKRITNFPFREHDTTLDSIFHNFKLKNNIFLKIDIEGDEFKLLNDILKFRHNLTGLVMEFHNLYILSEKMLTFAVELLDTHFVENININNNGDITEKGFPDVIEVTFSRRSDEYKYTRPKFSINYSNSLNYDNYYFVYQN